MNEHQSELYAQLLDLAAIGEDEIRARILFCDGHRKNKWLMNETSKVLGIKARLWARIPGTFPTEWAKELDKWELLTLTELIKLDTKKQRGDMAVLAHDWREKTMDYKAVKLCVEAKLTKPKRAPKESLAAKLQAFIVELEKESECGAGLELVCQRKAIADQLKGLLE